VAGFASSRPYSTAVSSNLRELLLEHLRSGEVHPGLEGVGRAGVCRQAHAFHVDAGGQSRCRTCDAERKRRERAEASARSDLVTEPPESLAA
jgi:hypothetical protein